KAVWPVQRGQPGKALDRDEAARRTHRERIPDEVLSEDASKSRQAMVDQTWRTGVEPQCRALAGHKTESDLGMSEYKPLHHIGDGGGLDPLRFHEFEPRRRRIKEI